MKNSHITHLKQAGKIAFSSLIILTSLPTVAQAPLRSWVNISPQAEVEVVNPMISRGFSYAPSPSHAGIVYAFSDHNVLIKSEDSGQTWTSVNLDTQSHVNLSAVVRNVGFSGGTSISNTRGVDSVLRVDAVDPLRLYAINNGLLSKSSDGGVHWQKMSQELLIDPGTFFLLNPQPMTQLLKGLVYTDNGEKRLATSTDGGEHWALAENIIEDVDGQEIIIEGIDPKNPLILYGTNDYEGNHPRRLSENGNFKKYSTTYSVYNYLKHHIQCVNSVVC